LQEASKLKGLLAFHIKSIYKLSFEVVYWSEKPDLQIRFELAFSMGLIKIAVIIGSTLPGRNSEAIAKWVSHTRRKLWVFLIIKIVLITGGGLGRVAVQIFARKAQKSSGASSS
jgi:hypothetical protein